MDKELILKELGKLIQKYRKLNKLTQDELAFRMNNSRTQISEIERGILDIKFTTLFRLQFILNIPSIEIFSNNNSYFDKL